MIATALAGLLVSAAAAVGLGGAPMPSAAAAKVQVSTTPPNIAQSTQTVASLYTGDRVRDPFMPALGAGSSARRVEAKDGEPPPPVDIHTLQLRGILKDPKADYALFASETGGTIMLRAGKLYDDRNKPVKGVTGRILLKQKTVQLITADKDVQVFRIGEKDEDKDKEKKAP